MAEAGPNAEARVRGVYQVALCRPPRADELADAIAFLGGEGGPETTADFCHVVFTLNEFLYVD
jgi:hypothetical protein